MSRESSIVASIERGLESIGAVYIKVHGTPNSKKGTPDIIGVYKGLPFAFEVKNETGKPSAIQEYRLEQWRRAGAVVGIVRSWQDVKDILCLNIE